MLVWDVSPIPLNSIPFGGSLVLFDLCSISLPTLILEKVQGLEFVERSLEL